MNVVSVRHKIYKTIKNISLVPIIESANIITSYRIELLNVYFYYNNFHTRENDSFVLFEYITFNELFLIDSIVFLSVFYDIEIYQ